MNTAITQPLPPAVTGRSFACQTCGKVFKNSGGLGNHVRYQHNRAKQTTALAPGVRKPMPKTAGFAPLGKSNASGDPALEQSLAAAHREASANVDRLAAQLKDAETIMEKISEALDFVRVRTL